MISLAAIPSTVFLGLAMAVFLSAAATLKTYVVSGQWWWLVVALGLYCLGNLMMVRLMRESGMAVAMSLSAVLQLVLSVGVAVLFFGERPLPVQWAGIALGTGAVALILWPSWFRP